MIASICSEPKVLEIFRIVNIFISIIRIIVPIILIFVLIFKFVSAIMSGNEDGLKKASSTAPHNIIAAVIIFLIPSFISIIIKITFPNNDYNNCLNARSIEEINIIYVNKMELLVNMAKESLNLNDYNNALIYLNNIKDETKIIEYKKQLDEIKEQIDEMNAVVNTPTVDRSNVVNEARQYIGKFVGFDCSGFVKHKVLQPLGYLENDILYAAGHCDGGTRGSYGMYLKYREKGEEVWHRDENAKSCAEAMLTFPGECVPGDIIFYTYGANDCVKHVVVYAGFENGKHMIIDSNMNDETVRYRAIDAITGYYIPLSCARPMKNEG